MKSNAVLVGMFRKGSIARTIVQIASRRAMMIDDVIERVAKKTGAAKKTIQWEFSCLCNPKDPWNHNRVRRDSRTQGDRVRIVAA